jgi:glyoxylase I family protein
VMSFELTTRADSLAFVIHRAARLGIGLTDHGGAVDGQFDERHTGLDHLAIAVPDVAAIHAWARRLDDHGVPHSPVTETYAGHHLNLRAPGNFPIELFVMSQAAAEDFGLSSPDEAVARFHT